MSDTQCQAMDHGPYILQGPIRLLDGNGTPMDVETGKTVALCRCGQSDNKPFCDGTHAKVDFDSEVRA